MSHGASYQTSGPVGEKAKAPGICLMVAAILSLIIMSVIFVLNIIAVASSPDAIEPPDIDASERIGFYIGYYGAMFSPLLNVIAQVVIMLGGIAMVRNKNIGLARTGAIVALIPCLSPFCIIGIPFGIWAVIVLFDPTVKAAFK